MAHPVVDDPAAALRGRQVLVVEDRSLIANRIEQILRGAGCEVIGPAPTLRAGQALAARHAAALDAAVLDIDLRDEAVYPLAEALRAADVPVLFLTGYGPLVIPLPWRDAPRLEKPFEADNLLRTLARIVARREGQPAGPTRTGWQPPPIIQQAWAAIRRSRDLIMEGRIRNEQVSRRWSWGGR